MGHPTLKWIWQTDCPVHGPRVPAKTGASWMSASGPVAFTDHEWPYIRDRTASARADRSRAWYMERPECRAAMPDWETLVQEILRFSPRGFNLVALDSLEGQCAQCEAPGPLHLVRLYPSNARTPKDCLGICFNAAGEFCNCPACQGGCHGLGYCDQTRHPKTTGEAEAELAPLVQPDPVDELEADLEAAAREMNARHSHSQPNPEVPDDA